MADKKRPSIDEIVSSMDYIKTKIPSEQRKNELVNVIDSFCDDSYEEGYSDAQSEELDIEESRVEKICTEYVVEKFSDCKTLEDFTNVFKEIETRSFNFMH